VFAQIGDHEREPTLEPHVNHSDEVLSQLDAAADESMFPDLNHGYFYLVDARLRLFADPVEPAAADATGDQSRRWALVVDIVGFSARDWNLVDVVHTFGNCLTAGRPGSENKDFHHRIDNMVEVLSVDDDLRSTYVGSVPMEVRGQYLTIDAPAGTGLPDAFRRLVPEHRDLLLADEGEVRRRLPADLPEILRLDEWNQHYLWDTRPSDHETYQQLAAVVATGDVSQYRPTMAPNSHWSNWPESGSL
jgi:hypothetical protein